MSVSRSKLTFHLLIFLVRRLPAVFVVVGVYGTKTELLVDCPIGEVLPLLSDPAPLLVVAEVLELANRSTEFQGLLDDPLPIRRIGRFPAYQERRSVKIAHFTNPENAPYSSIVSIALFTRVS